MPLAHYLGVSDWSRGQAVFWERGEARPQTSKSRSGTALRLASKTTLPKADRRLEGHLAEDLIAF